MPYSVSGELRIVASADLGEFGPTDGKPVLFHFSPLYHVQGLIPWLLLPLAFVALPENRNTQVAWILAPGAVLGAVYWAAVAATKPTSGSVAQANLLFTTIVLGLSLVWLLGERIGNRNRVISFLLAAFIYFGFLGVNLLSGGFNKDLVAISFLAAAMILPILFSLGMAAFLSSKRFGRVRFAVLTGVCLFISEWIIFLAVALPFDSTRSTAAQLSEALLVSLLIALVCFVCLLPFLVVLWTNRFWRRRFECVAGIRADAR